VAKKIKEPVVVELPDEIKELFPNLEGGKTPSKRELKERVIELDAAGEKESAAKLMGWQAEREENAPLTKTQKSIRTVIFVMLVLIGIMSVFWFVYQSNSEKNNTFVVCLLNGQTLSGADCVLPTIEPQAPIEGSTGEELIPGTIPD